MDAIYKCISMFGVERCMFASNFPVDKRDGWPAVRLFAAFRRLAEARFSKEQQRMLFGGTARRIYRVGVDEEDLIFNWAGLERERIQLAEPLLVIRGSKGWAACAYANVATAEKLGEAAIIFSGVKDHNAFLSASVQQCSHAAKLLGVFKGMRGADAIELIR